jgi:hypothetical protein
MKEGMVLIVKVRSNVHDTKVFFRPFGVKPIEHAQDHAKIEEHHL